MAETDEFVSYNSEGYPMDPISISTAYLKMKNLCVNMSDEIQADMKIHSQNIFPRYLAKFCEVALFNKLTQFEDHILHSSIIYFLTHHFNFSSIDLTNITASVYSTELCNRLRSFLSSCPPSSPQPHVNELLTATADFERDLDLWNIRYVIETS